MAKPPCGCDPKSCSTGFLASQVQQICEMSCSGRAGLCADIVQMQPTSTAAQGGRRQRPRLSEQETAHNLIVNPATGGTTK